MSTQCYSSDSSSLFAVLENAAWLYCARIVEVLVRVVYVIVLARFLGSAGYGLFSYGQSFYLSLLLFGSLGVNVMLARAAGSGSVAFSQMIRQTLALRLVVLAVLIAVFFISILGLHDHEMERRMLALLGFALIGRGLAFWTHQVFIVAARSRVILLLNIFWRPMELGLVTFLLLQGGGLLMVALAHSIIWCAEAVFALMLVKRIPLPVRPEWDRSRLVTLFRRGVPLGLLAGATNYLMLGPLLFFPHLISNPLGLGQLAVVLQALFVFSAMGWSVGNAALPALSRELESGSLTRQYSSLATRLGWLLGLVLTIFWIEFGPILFPLLLGADYGTAGELIGYAMFVLAPLTWGATLSHVLLARRQHITALICILAGSAGMTLSAYLFIPAYGVFGGVWALLTGVVVWTMAIIAVLFRSGCLDMHNALLKPGCVALSVAAVYVLLQETHPLIALCGAVLVLLPTAVGFGAITREERLWLTNRLSMKWSNGQKRGG